MERYKSRLWSYRGATTCLNLVPKISEEVLMNIIEKVCKEDEVIAHS